MYIIQNENDLFCRHAGQIGEHPNWRDIHSDYGVNHTHLCNRRIDVHVETR